MPLDRAKDSYLDLVDLKQSKDDLEASKHPNILDVADSVGGADAADIPTPYWKAGFCWTEHEHVAPLRLSSDKKPTVVAEKEKTNHSCFPFKNPWEICNGLEESDDDDENDESNDYDSQIGAPSPREGGIVKRASVAVQVFMGVGHSRRQTYTPKTFLQRPVSLIKLTVKFLPLKRVVVIQPLYTMTVAEKSNCWWQLKDFSHFKKEIALLARPEEESKACAIWLEHQKGSVHNMDNKDEEHTWWHKYGDSRRGMEKYASTQEARQTIMSYKLAIKKVLAEQSRQQLFRWGDPEKLAWVYLEYTAWSRDLALAAAASDEDAVKTDFDDSKRRSREFFLLKQIFKEGEKIHKHVPEFMLPKGLKPKGFLDEHASNHHLDQSPGRTINNIQRQEARKTAKNMTKQSVGFPDNQDMGAILNLPRVPSV